MGPDARPRTRGWLLVGFGVLSWVGYSLIAPDSWLNSPESWLNRPSAIRCIREWGRLAPFPESARDLRITTEGGMFTRTFRASFDAQPEDIARWLDESPGTRESKPVSDAPGVRSYQIKPGGGAIEATVDVVGSRVHIHVVWS